MGRFSDGPWEGQLLTLSTRNAQEVGVTVHRRSFAGFASLSQSVSFLAHINSSLPKLLKQ